MEVKEESEKAGLKPNIQKTKIMTSSPITSGQIDGETMETMTDFIFLFSKITADGDCSHEIKRHLLLGRKAMTNLDSILLYYIITLTLHVIHVVTKSWTRLSNFTFPFHFHALEKEVATHSVFLPGESQGQGSLVDCSPWGHKELDTTERLHFHFDYMDFCWQSYCLCLLTCCLGWS